MSQQIYILGMPGLYQNWLLGSLDAGSNLLTINKHNFKCLDSNVRWVRKFDYLDSPGNIKGTGINTYVEDKNFIWYLYNFLEKTDSVGIHVANLVENLIIKAPGTEAFNFMLKHFVESYNIDKTTDYQIIKNSLIEYFYYLLIDHDSLFKKKATFVHDGLINIEYNDFQNVDLLLDRLSPIDLDKDHFVKQYKNLYIQNRCFIDRKQYFKIRLEKNQLDILEVAYLGYLVTQNTNNGKLDWFNTQVREQVCNDYKKDFKNWLNY